MGGDFVNRLASDRAPNGVIGMLMRIPETPRGYGRRW
jgi:hypothetical protein